MLTVFLGAIDVEVEGCLLVDCVLLPETGLAVESPPLPPPQAEMAKEPMMATKPRSFLNFIEKSLSFFGEH